MMDVTRLGFAPYLGWWILCIIGVAALIIWVLYAFKGGRAWLTRALALSLLGLALANPLIIREDREPLKSTLAVIMDRSPSMDIDERASLSEDVLSALQSQMPNLESFELRMIETRPDALETDLAGTMIASLSGTPRSQIAGTVLVTDGQVHDLPSDLSILEPFGPVHSLIVGKEDEKDRQIKITAAPSYGIVGETATLSVNVEAEVPVLGVRVTVNDKDPYNVPVRPGEDTPIEVEIDRRGPNTIVFSIPESQDELTYVNNITAATVSGVRDTLRVLLITGEPHQGGRAWRDLLKSDPMVDLVHFTILRPPHKQDATPTSELALIAFPTMELFEEKLDEFDLIIFDRYRRRGVLHLRYLDNIARYVDNGGALLIAAGEPFAGPASLHRTPLASVLPLSPTGRIEEKPFIPQISELGEKHSVTATLDEESFGEWYRYIDAREVTGDVLMTTPNGDPLLALDRVGDGRVAELMSDQLWLWARGHDGGGPFSELVRRLVHWMMKEPELEEEHLTLKADGDDLIAEMTTLNPEPEPLTLTLPGGQKEILGWQKMDGLDFETRIKDAKYGLYRGEVDELEAIYLLGPAQPREYADLRSTTEKLTALGDATNGSTRRVEQAGDTPRIRVADGGAGNDWIGLKDRKAYIVRDSETQPILPAWLVAGMLFGLLLLAWRREGR
jgi:hypothetical protein